MGGASSAFAALKSDGSVVTWGAAQAGGNSSIATYDYSTNLVDYIDVSSQLTSGVTKIFSTLSAFAALKSDGTVVTWRDSSSGGASSGVSIQLTGVTEIFSNREAFAALKSDGSVVTWGNSGAGGDSSGVSNSLTSGVTKIFSTLSAFAALKDDGSVVTWGYSDSGGNSSGVSAQLTDIVGLSTPFSTSVLTNVVCFLAGTLIATPDGDRAIESLKVGDEIATKSGIHKIKFVCRSSRKISCLIDLGRLPICIQAGAFGDAGPTQDLWISPSHAVLVMGHLVEASALLNWTTVTQPDFPGSPVVTYYNIELENHEITRANGLEVETYYANWRGDGYSRVDWDNYDDYIALYGESNGMKELDMPRIPFARQLPAELRLMLQLNESNQSPELALQR